MLGTEGAQEAGSSVLCDHQEGEGHSARGHVLGTESAQEAGNVLCDHQEGEGHSARGHVLGTEGNQEAGSLTRCRLESDSEGHSSRS